MKKTAPKKSTVKPQRQQVVPPIKWPPPGGVQKPDRSGNLGKFLHKKKIT